ncbi:MAG TPA: Sec-independent protein translocase protein TatB [Pseudolabrys sp.]|jgi:sec-independent protein translocase protein TatB|nr:Sec-independent protein translocase protein TatB [Pseudolabrys sp.]
MFDIGWGELVVIGIVALIAIGPKELPTVLRTLGQYMAKIRRMAAEFQGQFQEAMREAEMAELKKQAEDLKSSVSDIASFDPMAKTQKEIERALEMPEMGNLVESSTEAAPATPSTLPEPVQQPEVNVPLPEPPSPVSEKDFAPVEAPPKKQAGGGG